MSVWPLMVAGRLLWAIVFCGSVWFAWDCWRTAHRTKNWGEVGFALFAVGMSVCALMINLSIWGV
jgi:hypothetical protein